MNEMGKEATKNQHVLKHNERHGAEEATSYSAYGAA